MGGLRVLDASLTGGMVVFVLHPSAVVGSERWCIAAAAARSEIGSCSPFMYDAGEAEPGLGIEGRRTR